MGKQPQFLERINTKDITNMPKKKKKIIFYGDSPTCATGFGQVSRNILPFLLKSERYEIDVLGINYWGDPHEYPFGIWPMAVNNHRDPYGRQRLQQHLLDPRLEYDILFFLQDTFILNFLPTLISSLQQAGKRFRSVYYYPIDGIPKVDWIKSAASVDYPVTYSEFGRQQSIEAVPELEGRLRVIPHGVNPAMFFPLPADQTKQFRRQFFGHLSEKFLLVNVNRNQQRKDIPATIAAFREFRKYCPESFLYLHMMANDQGWNLPEVIKSFGLDITRDVILPQNFAASTGFSLEVLNMIYNAADCVVSTALGEGFGLSWVEAMATKTPVVFPMNTCLTEFITEETGWPYRSGGDIDHITVLPNDNEVVRPTAHIGHMVEQLVTLYNNREEGTRRAENAFNMVQNNLIWDKHINPCWLALFDEVAFSDKRSFIANTSPSQQVLRGDML